MRDRAMTARVRPAAEPAWDSLQAALLHTVPDCADDGRYITDRGDLDPAERAIMRDICAACPLYELCADYAATERPAAGWWPRVNL